jgi:hypothetical protein
MPFAQEPESSLLRTFGADRFCRDWLRVVCSYGEYGIPDGS